MLGGRYACDMADAPLAANAYIGPGTRQLGTTTV